MTTRSRPTTTPTTPLQIIETTIERQDGHAFCGRLEFLYLGRAAVVLWTAEVQAQQIIIEFFPGSDGYDVEGVVRENQKQLLDDVCGAITCVL